MERNTPQPAYKARNRRRQAQAWARADVLRDIEHTEKLLNEAEARRARALAKGYPSKDEIRQFYGRAAGSGVSEQERLDFEARLRMPRQPEHPPRGFLGSLIDAMKRAIGA